MKTTVTFALSFLCLLSCSRANGGNEDANAPSGSGKINPPSWIIGTWKQKPAISGTALIYTFSKGEIVMSGSGQVVSLKNFISNGGEYTQQSSSSTFQYTMGAYGQVSSTYTFTKTSATTLEFDPNWGAGTVELIKQ